jgi:TPR repeat protein
MASLWMISVAVGKTDADATGVRAAYAAISASAPPGKIVDFGLSDLEAEPREPNATHCAIAAQSLVAFAERGSSIALGLLGLIRIFSGALPREWYARHAANISAPLSVRRNPSQWCERLGLSSFLASNRDVAQIDLSLVSGGIDALRLAACLAQTSLDEAVVSARSLHRQYSSGRSGRMSFVGVDERVATWFSSAQAEASRLPAGADDEDGEDYEKESFREEAEADLGMPWVRSFDLRKGTEALPLDASYVALTERSAALASLADFFADEIDTSSTALTALALLHLSAVEAQGWEVPGTTPAAVEGTSSRPLATIFDSTDSAYQALALAAFLDKPGLAHLSLSYAARTGSLPRALQRGAGRCQHALPWASSLAQDVAHSENDAALTLEDIPQLWERHEDALLDSRQEDPASSVDFLRAEAEQDDDAWAIFDFAELLEYGDPAAGVAPNAAAAVPHLERAAELGLPDARARLGAALLRGLLPGDFGPNATAARRHLEIAADEGSIDALSHLGYIYVHGIGVERNFSLALAFMRRAAESGFVAAHHGIASILLQPDVVDEEGKPLYNATLASHHLQLAADAGHVPSKFNLGVLALEAESSAADGSNCEKAYSLFREVAGRAAVSNGIANLLSAYNAFASGDTEAAFLQYLILAAAGVSDAQDNAAFLLEKHSGLRHLLDLTRAARAPHFHAASDEPPFPLSKTQSRPISQTDEVSVRALPLRAVAFGLYLSAADLGSHHAMTALARCLSSLFPDVHWCSSGSSEALLSAATAWLSLASSEGSGHAAFTLAMAHARGKLGSINMPSNNLTEAWILLDRVDSADFLASWVAFSGRCLVVWQELCQRGGSKCDNYAGLGDIATAFFRVSVSAIKLVWQSATGFDKPEPSSSSETSNLPASLLGDGLILVSRTLVLSCAVGALLLSCITVLLAAPPQARELHRA